VEKQNSARTIRESNKSTAFEGKTMLTMRDLERA